MAQEVMKRYHVMLESKQTLSQEAETVTVGYDSPTYQDAWVGARTVCRLGTNFDENGNGTRVFYTLDTDEQEGGEPFAVQPAVYTVRRIFVEGTRKQGKRRMTTVDAETFKKVLGEKKIKMSAPLEALLTEVLNEAGGAKITVATARRLGIVTPDTEAGGGDTEAA